MPMLLPVYPELPCFRYVVTLSGRPYKLTWTWNLRAGRWMLDLALEGGTRLASGLRIVIRTALPSYRNDERLPAGSIIALDMSGRGVELAAREELGQRIKVFYIDPSEVPVSDSREASILVRELT